MQLEPGSIKAIQKYVEHKIKSRGFEDETLQESLLLLTEEVGELVKACRKVSGISIDKKRESDQDVGGEVADVINLIFAVGVKLALNIEEEFIKKNKVVDQRFYERVNMDEPSEKL